jgi:lipid-A-disaccharide synthase-like uncharacterized protein
MKDKNMDGTPVMATVRLMEEHKATWRNKPEWFWFLSLLEEVFELLGALIGWHKDPVKWELMQIAAICMNWIDMRERKNSK